jgi:hypothetical protein
MTFSERRNSDREEFVDETRRTIHERREANREEALNAERRRNNPVRPQTRREKIAAIAQTGGYNPAEAAVAQEMLKDNAVVAMARFDQALVEAKTLGELQEVHAMGVALRAGAKALGLGIESENVAAKGVLRAERNMGVELDRMTDEDERRAKGSNQHHSDGDDLPGLPELGVSMKDAFQWRELARIPEDEFENVIAELFEQRNTNGFPVRLSRANLVREWFGSSPKAPDLREHLTAEDTDFDLFRQGAYGLVGWEVNDEGVGGPTRNGLRQLPFDELLQVKSICEMLMLALSEATGGA